jgi:hypothetical protein
MGDPPRARDPGEDADLAPDRGSPPPMPRWVKVSGIIVAVLVLLLVVVLLVSGGHGPRRHASGGAGSQASVSVSSVTASLTLPGGPGGRQVVWGEHR